MRFASSPSPAIAAASSSPPVTAAAVADKRAQARVRVPARGTRAVTLGFNALGLARSATRLRAGLTEIEPDLQEDPIDRWRTNGVSPEDFIYGEYDGHHTYHEGHEGKKGFWESVAEEYQAAEPPTGFQGVFVVIFCAIEMGKPDKPHNFEPQIYNMERGARDKLIADYNSMDIWDFNEKYGELWDFTVKRDDIVKP